MINFFSHIGRGVDERAWKEKTKDEKRTKKLMIFFSFFYTIFSLDKKKATTTTSTAAESRFKSLPLFAFKSPCPRKKVVKASPISSPSLVDEVPLERRSDDDDAFFSNFDFVLISL